MAVELRIQGPWLALVGPGIDERRPLNADDVEQLEGFAASYRKLLGKDNRQPQLLTLGKALYAWLDGNERWLQRLRGGLVPPWVLEVRGPRAPQGSEWSVLQAPWELLADEHGFLAQDAPLGFSPIRRLGDPTDPPKLSEYRLGLTFMAGAPRGPSELDYEAEENAILKAASLGGIDLVVEDSGNPEILGERLGDLEDMPVLHLSCHGHNAYRPRPSETPRPVLLLEDEAGDALPTDATSLVQALGAHRPRLLALSACLSAATPEPDKDTEEVTDSLATALIRAGLPAVLGWEGSVYDHEATAFAHTFYEQLGRRQPLEVALSVSRQRLLSADPQRPSRDWHLARLWLSPQGGGPVVGGKRKRTLVSPDRGFKEFLDKQAQRSPVASQEAFVGRRREIQTGLRVLRGQDHGGLLIHGMGRLGKSSLAARLANRLGSDYAIAVVYERYDALSVFEAVYEAVKAHRPARELLDGAKTRVRDDPGQLPGVLLDLLSGPCAQKDSDGPPVLLIIDDLEQILEEPSKSGAHTVRADVVPVLRGVLSAFAPATTDSRVILTSRYTFTLPDSSGRDQAKTLYACQLPPMREGARRKLTLRQAEQLDRVTGQAALGSEELATRLPLLDRAQQIARGNPGLQDLLGGIVFAPEATLLQINQALEEMEAYLVGQGPSPNEVRLQAFLKDLALEKLVTLAGPEGRELLRRATLLEQPVPLAVMAELGENGADQVVRLQGLGLLDRFEDLVEANQPGVLVNDLARPKAGTLLDSERTRYAERILPTLFRAWGGTQGRDRRPYVADHELTRLGLAAQNAEVLEACATGAVAGLEQALAYREAAALGQAVIAILDQAGGQPPLHLLRRTGEDCVMIGRAEEAGKLYERGINVMETYRAQGQPVDARDQALFLGTHADLLIRQGQLDEALRIRTEEELPVYERLGDVRSKAVTQGKIADILYARGQLDEALRIRTEEQLPVYERLGDVREKAVTQGKIADILYARGQLDEALRIHTEEELPVYERLGDVRSKAVTQGQIADILYARGQLDEALRIRTEEELPVYERLGDVREKAVTQGKIADILYARGQLDEALRIRTEEQLPVYERLGDVREKAVTQGKIADILYARGQLDEALRLLQDEVLPGFERLGDVRSKAVTQGKIADILYARGQLDEALRIRTEEQLPVYERLGDVREKAVTQGKIADILYARGQLDEALRICTEEQLPVYERLGDVRSKAVTQGKIADILYARGQLDEALRIRTEEQLPVYERLGDVRSKAVTQGKIADILYARGQLDEALRLLQDEVFPDFERLGDVRSKAVTQGKIADILYARGQLDEALRLLQDEVLPGFERLGDVRSLLVGRAKLAMILLQRDQEGDRERARANLCQALEAALGLQIPETEQIVQLLLHNGMRCEFIPEDIWIQMEAQLEKPGDG